MVVCLERGADLHMAQLMPLPLTVSCFNKIQIGFTFFGTGLPGKRAIKWVCVYTLVNREAEWASVGGYISSKYMYSSCDDILWTSHHCLLKRCWQCVEALRAVVASPVVNTDERRSCIQRLCQVRPLEQHMMHGSECDIQIWWTEVDSVAQGCQSTEGSFIVNRQLYTLVNR